MLRRGPRAGDRLPDAGVTRDGQPTSLHRAVIGPHFSLVLCGEPGAWDGPTLGRLAERHSGLVEIHRLSRDATPGTLVDGGRALALLGVVDRAQYLVRPDGHIGFRCAGSELAALMEYLERWFPGPSDRGASG